MQSQRESVIVGLFVLIAGAIFFSAVFTMTGAFARSTTKFHAYFQFAGGLESGATVRYAGGPKIGRVESVQLDPKNPGQLDVVFSIQPDLPIKTHKYHVGDAVYYNSPSFGRAAATGTATERAAGAARHWTKAASFVRIIFHPSASRLAISRPLRAVIPHATL